MKKMLALFASLFLCAAFLPACSDDADKPLVVACVASSSPYCYYVGGGTGGGGLNRPVAGIDVDLIQEIGKELGRPVQYKIVPFQHIFTLVATGKADIGAAGLTITQERAQQVLFSNVYDTSSQVVVVPEDSDITDGKTLKQTKVAAQEGTTDISYLREVVKPKLVLPFLTQEDVNDALVEGRADAAMMDLMQAEYLVKASQEEECRILDDPVCEVQYGLIFNKKDSKLADVANKVIAEFKSSGGLQKSREKHIKALDALPLGAQRNDEVKPFVVCVESSFAPFVFMNRNKLMGVDIEMAEAIADELKRPLQIRIVPFSEILPLVESGAADMGASGISITYERKNIVLFSIPYEKNVRRILVSEDSPYKTIRQLNGKVIGAKKGTTNEEYAATMLQAGKMQHYDNPTQGVMGLIDHEVDAYVDDEGEAELIAGKYAGKIRMLDIVIPAEEYGYAFQLDDLETKEAADKVIGAKRRNGELPALFRKYNSIYMTLDLNDI
jgi:polar amino acid transport system substrate-binding protein